MLIYLLIFLTSFLTVFLLLPMVIPLLEKAGIYGKNQNKPENEGIAEMGGLIMVLGFGLGLILVIALKTFLNLFPLVPLVTILTVLSVELFIIIIGTIDDLISMPQLVKAIIPALASLPLIALETGHTVMTIPIIGKIDFGLFYTLFLLPLGMTGAVNAVNMLAGFNGLEIGMGLVMFTSLLILSIIKSKITVIIILLPMIGSMLATLRYNWYPAKVLIGDVGTLSIGAVLASVAIIGNFQTAGVILIIPYFIDFLFKAFHGFPSENWWGVYKEGKLYCPERGPVGFAQWVMKIFNGITERNLVIFFMIIEGFFALFAIKFYL